MSMKKETIDDATLAAIKGPIGLKNSIETCLVNKLPSPTFQFIEDGTRFVVSGVGTVEISLSKKEIRASNKDLLQRAHQILRECANPKVAQGIREAKKLRLVSRDYGKLTGDPKLDAMALAGEYVTGAKGTPMAAIQTLKRAGRKTRKGKKTRKMSRRRRQ